MEKIITFDGSKFLCEDQGLETHEANQQAVNQANAWLEQNKKVEILHRSVHTNGDQLVIVVWFSTK